VHWKKDSKILPAVPWSSPTTVFSGPHLHTHPRIRRKSEVFFFEGTYSEYEENKKMRLGNEEPKRVRIESYNSAA
jgi:hypothetical protein